jgi:hypothetical protein
MKHPIYFKIINCPSLGYKIHKKEGTKVSYYCNKLWYAYDKQTVDKCDIDESGKGIMLFSIGCHPNTPIKCRPLTSSEILEFL